MDRHGLRPRDDEEWPSLRAQRGDPWPRFVIASAAWRSIVEQAEALDCRAALAMTESGLK